MDRRSLIILLIASGVAMAAFGDRLQGLLAGVIAGTTTDPRSLGLMQSANMKPIRATLRTDVLLDAPRHPRLPGPQARGDYHLTFEAPAAYYSGIGKPQPVRGNQAVSFSFWSKTGDPTGPDHIEHRRRCYSNRQPIWCPDDPLAKRFAAGEWEIEIEMFNAVNTVAEQRRLKLGQLDKARSITEACVVYDDVQLGMTVVTVPEKDYPPPVESYVPKPNFCGGIYIYQRDRSLYRGDPTPRYYPPAIFHKFDDNGEFKFRVDCSAFTPANRERFSKLCTMGVDLGSWGGRVWISPKHIAEWDKAHSDVMSFLKRHVVSPQIVWEMPPATD